MLCDVSWLEWPQRGEVCHKTLPPPISSYRFFNDKYSSPITPDLSPGFYNRALISGPITWLITGSPSPGPITGPHHRASSFGSTTAPHHRATSHCLHYTNIIASLSHYRLSSRLNVHPDYIWSFMWRLCDSIQINCLYIKTTCMQRGSEGHIETLNQRGATRCDAVQANTIITLVVMYWIVLVWGEGLVSTQD